MRLVLGLVLLTVAACDTTAPEPDFGAGYTIASGTAVLDGDTLRATVTYSGGCEAHTFRAQSRRAGGGVEVWLVHGGTPDLCEALVADAVAVPVSLPADAAFVALLRPDGGTLALR